MARKKITTTAGPHSAKRPRQQKSTAEKHTTKGEKTKKQKPDRPGARVIKKAHRFRSGTAALREIRWLQTHGDHKQKKPTATFARAPFERIVRAIAGNLMDGARFNARAIDALKCASEEMVSERLNAGMTVLAAQSREIKRGKFKGSRTGPVTLRTSHTAAYTRIMCMGGGAPYLADCRDDADRLLGVQSQRTLHPISREDDEEERLARRQRRGKPATHSGEPRRKSKKSGAVAAAVGATDAPVDARVPTGVSIERGAVSETKAAGPVDAVVDQDANDEDSKGSTEVDVVAAAAPDVTAASAGTGHTAAALDKTTKKTTGAPIGDKTHSGAAATSVADEGLIAMDLGDTDDDASDGQKEARVGTDVHRPVGTSAATPVA